MVRKYIYTNDVLKSTFTEHPMMNFPNTSHTYISEDVLKSILTEQEFKRLSLKIRQYNTSLDKNKEKNNKNNDERKSNC